jgi:hypothetical protein|tara:strand:+ start:507 stop:1175 length:669 start_codon:yes stop_codon:yes gene_type:complete
MHTNNKLYNKYILEDKDQSLLEFLEVQNYDNESVIDDYLDIVENLVDINERDEIVETIESTENESWFGGVDSNGFRKVGFYKSNEVESLYSTDSLFCQDDGIEVYNAGELTLNEFIDLKVWYKYDFTEFNDIEMYDNFLEYKKAFNKKDFLYTNYRGSQIHVMYNNFADESMFKATIDDITIFRKDIVDVYEFIDDRIENRNLYNEIKNLTNQANNNYNDKK